MALESLHVLNSRLAKGLIAFVMIAGFGVWFYFNEQGIRKEAWKGVVTEKWEKKPSWFRAKSYGIGDQARYQRRIDYYWRVKKDDGSSAEVEVPLNLYTAGNPGTRVEKIYSQRYPKIAQ